MSQLGWQDLGFREVSPGELTDMHGATDFIDQLAREAVLLDQMYVSPVCSPTRAQLMVR
jgi:arylsulfatase A-like enzyme